MTTRSLGGKAQSLTQAEILERLSPVPFDMRERIPKDAEVIKPHPERWWRSNSPVREGQEPDEPETKSDPVVVKASTRGVMNHGKRTGAINYQTQYQCGLGTAAHFKIDEAVPPTVSGYSGHVAGKYAGNIIGGTYDKTIEDAYGYLQTTRQAMQYPPAK
mmetsp:Transcript_11321/g.26056  ORF Transcript_11321/g.26056 Transcript_11321/m.26056 type:complete len:160 (-) Transcript_11321:223-702(-)|eukprot:CAMPEP_0178405150 /NCGR_PEP_ID=MMETSP0689_2-20121128/18252_1 /TAXON_ID=160604 /ORGANISM="Amphidinium massartii, Strain CS-259" /LENGTH=159 /DNA_ID=CAMNT_0020026159 /DNA_START=81 /DNA_END=560 /DNA_ORIENTATION=+